MGARSQGARVRAPRRRGVQLGAGGPSVRVCVRAAAISAAPCGGRGRGSARGTTIAARHSVAVLKDVCRQGQCQGHSTERGSDSAGGRRVVGATPRGGPCGRVPRVMYPGCVPMRLAMRAQGAVAGGPV